MNIDRDMVNLFFEIKRSIPREKQIEMRISNPRIGEIITSIYCKTNDENIKLLTRIFLQRAGDDWLENADRIAAPSRSLIQKMPHSPNNVRSSSKPRSKPIRIYRGQIIED